MQVGRRPNPELFAIDVTSVPLFAPMPMPFPLPIPTAPSEPLARAAYLKEWVPHTPTFRQRTQPWHALRAATRTASSIAFLLGVLPDDRSEPFRAMFGDGGQQPSSDVFAMQWSVEWCCILACKLSKGQRKHCHRPKIQRSKRSACP